MENNNSLESQKNIQSSSEQAETLGVETKLSRSENQGAAEKLIARKYLDNIRAREIFAVLSNIIHKEAQRS